MATNTASTDTHTKIDTLIIEGIDLELLEWQRQQLISVEPRVIERIFGTEAAGALTGLQNMLDAWADERDGHV